nr:NAD(P)-binding protein [Paenibacillus sp. DMB5]
MYAIIGAGPMGLCTARQLKKYGIDFVGFEPHSDVGGLWDIDNPHSSMYHSAHLISSKGTTEFREFLMCAEVAPYPHHSEMRRYFRDYRQAVSYPTSIINSTPACCRCNASKMAGN